MHGAQLWVAQPERTRRPGRLRRHPELPRAELDNAVRTVLVGSFAEASSPARRDNELVGVDMALRPGRSVWPLDPTFEYALVVLDGQALVQGRPVRPGQLYLGRGRDQLELEAADPGQILLLGGEPFDEPILMWWNFVARAPEEIAAAARRARPTRFGQVDSAFASASPAARLRPPGVTGDLGHVLLLQGDDPAALHRGPEQVVTAVGLDRGRSRPRRWRRRCRCRPRSRVWRVAGERRASGVTGRSAGRGLLRM